MSPPPTTTGSRGRPRTRRLRLLVRRHSQPRPLRPGRVDLLSDLATAWDDDEPPLSERELVFTGQTLLIAGHETTTNVIGKMVALLLADRRRWERLLADPSLVPLAVEEALRFDAEPGIGVPAPGEMRLDRSPNPHLAFGAGPHACLGQELVRTELRTVLHVLLRRLPSLELAAPTADLRRLEGLAVGGLSEVPVRW
ncbi:cytochrome P450 [Streptomyces sp. NPDC006476]|uniref:cytochrome P450 n=1 Tax=Streptomyces sp. NPDC006476 TaxID=3157175 RepID=UPI0033BD3EF2